MVNQPIVEHSINPNSASPETIAIDVKGKKKKKKKYSRGMKAGQEMEVALTRGSHRLAMAIGDGLDAWRQERNRSARKKKDGAIRDALRNYGRSMAKFGREAAKIPEDITDAWPKLSRLFR